MIRTLIAGCVAGAFLALPALAAELTLKTATALGANTAFGKVFLDLVEHINKTHKGTLQVRMIGGPEAMPPFEMGTALQNGVLDFVHIPANFYEKLVPAGTAIGLSEISVEEMRKNGAFAFLNELHEKGMNAKLLTLWGYGINFHIYTTKKTDGVNLADMKLRVAPGFSDIIKAHGGSVIQTAPGEVYTALERGVISGYTWPLWGIQDLGWDRVTKYRIDPGFRNVRVAILVNKGVYDKMTPAQRKALDDSIAWYDKHTEELIKARNAEERAIQEKAGVQSNKLTDAQYAAFTAKAREVGWEEALKKSPDIAKLRELVTAK